MKFRECNIEKLSNLLELHNQLDEASKKYTIRDNNINYGTMLEVLNAVHSIYEKMPDSFKEEYGNEFFKEIPVSSSLRTEIKFYEKSIEYAKEFQKGTWSTDFCIWCTETITIIKAIDKSKYHIDKVFNFIKYLRHKRLHKGTSYYQFYNSIYDECIRLNQFMLECVYKEDVYLKEE